MLPFDRMQPQNNKPQPAIPARVLTFVGLLAGLFLCGAASSPDPTFGAKAFQAKGFKIGEPYGPPYEKQIKSLLEAGKALPLPGGKYLLSEGVILHTFSETNTAQLVVRVDQCFYEPTARSIDSSGPIQMQTADGKFTIQGTGFFWQQTNSSLIISNQVHTTIQADLLQTPSSNRTDNLSSPDTGPLSILSDRFRYEGASGRGVWRDHVSVTGTNLALTSDVLTAEVPQAEHQVRSLVAEHQVIVDYTDIHATGQRMDYAPDTGLVRISDQATWRSEQREGRGDELVIDRTNRIFQVNGHAWLKLPGQAMGDSGFLSFSNSLPNRASSTGKSSIEIVCDSYEIRTNCATFRNQVQLEEHLDNTVRGRMSCKLMTATFAGTNQLQTLVANEQVIIEQEDKRFTGGIAVYTQTNTTLEITQNPTWRSGLRAGKGDLLRINTLRNEMLVRGNASLHLPANELAGQFSPTPSVGSTNHPAPAGTNQFADVFCEQYTLGTNSSIFLGGVYATHPEMNWSCEKLTVRTPAPGTTNLIAEQNVVFDVMTQNGKLHGTGDDAVYTFGFIDTITNGALPINELSLTGTPAVLTNSVSLEAGSTNRPWGMANRLFIWDRARNKLIAPGGDYKMQGWAKAIDTNLFMLPNKKLPK